MQRRILIILSLTVGCVAGVVGAKLAHIGSGFDAAVTYLDKRHDVVTAGTAVAALFVSLLSLLLTTFSMTTQRFHNRVSLMPIGFIMVGDYEDNIFVRLYNYGVGPMLITKLTVNRTNTSEEARSTLIDYVSDLPNGLYWSNFVEHVDGRVVAKDGHITLIHLEGSSANKKFASARDTLRRELSSLTVTVAYKNIYGQKMKPANRSLDWFGRNIS